MLLKEDPVILKFILEKIIHIEKVGIDASENISLSWKII